MLVMMDHEPKTNDAMSSAADHEAQTLTIEQLHERIQQYDKEREVSFEALIHIQCPRPER